MILTMRIKRKFFAILLLLFAVNSSSIAGDTENEASYRIGVEMAWKLFKVDGLKFSINPEFRFSDGFSYESFHLEPALRYKTFGFLYWGVNYRLSFSPDEDSMTPATTSRYGFSVTARETFGRFTPSVKVLFSNYTDEDIDDKKYLRYRAKLKYNIRKSKFSPYVAGEIYQNLVDDLISKYRYCGGFEFKVKKNNYVDFNYKLDYYTQKYKNRHIFSLGYKVDF